MLYLDPLQEADFDVLHPLSSADSLLGRLNAQAFGPAYPAAIEPFGHCSLPLLRHAAAAMAVQPGDHLVDLGCGSGGPGIWLARQRHLRLTGVDFSASALRLARKRAAAASLAQPASFHYGLLTRTGLPSGCADAVISIDALLYAPDRSAALSEIHRILRPGGRAIVTVTAQPDESLCRSYPRAISDWAPLATQAGLTLRQARPDPRLATSWLKLYQLWQANARLLRHGLGVSTAGQLLLETSLPPQLLEQQHDLILLLGKT